MNASGISLVFLYWKRYNCAKYVKLRTCKVCFVTWQLSLFYIPLRNLLALAVDAGDDIYPEAPCADIGIGIPGPKEDILEDSESLLALHPVAVGNLERWF